MRRSEFLKRTMRPIILLESSPHWEPELRRRIPDIDEELTICRTVNEARQALTREPDHIFICCLAPIAGDLLLLLGETIECHRTGGVVVFRRSDEAEIEWNLREIGVAAVLLDRYESGVELERYCRILGKSTTLGSADR